MKRKFKFGINQVAFVAMCATICVCALMTVNCKLKTNQFIAQYTEKYTALQEELTQLKSETSSASASVDNLTYHTDAIYDTLKASIESGSTIVKDPADTSTNTKSATTDTKAETDDTELITESKVETEANPNPNTSVDSSSEAATSTEQIKEDTKSTEINHDNIGMARAINASDLTKPSNLSVEQFNSIIESALSDHGYDYSSSALYNTGESLYNMEQTYGINGLFALSIASEESEYGFSSLAQNKHNPFGISGGSGYRGFDSMDEAIQYFGNLISQYYVGCGRTSISSIGDKYCPGSSSWVSDTSWFFKMYGNVASNI